jgi:gliding motility-associated lipoprotein GldH
MLPQIIRIPALCLCIATLCISCSDGSVYSKFSAISNQEWRYLDTLSFAPELKDSTGLYDVMLMVRYKKDYEFSNLWLQTRHNLSGKDTFQRIEIVLFNPDGSPKGKVLGNTCSTEVPWMKGISLSSADSIYIQLVQNMRKDPLPGVMDTGIKIFPAKNNTD